MKYVAFIGFIVGGMFICSCMQESALPPDGVWLARFPDNKEAALSFTFDDNPASSLTIIAPLFTKYHLPATFFVITDQISTDDQWQNWKDLHEAGFEIGNHTMSHLDLRNIEDTSVLNTQINGAYQIIEAKIGVPPFSFAHPYHHTNELADQFVFQKHHASRLSPSGFCHWVGISNEIAAQTVDEMMQTAIDNHEWLVTVGHGVNDGWKPISEPYLVNLLENASRHAGNLSIDTFEGLSKYKIEREETKVSTRADKDYLTISLISGLDPLVFDYPLTVVVENNAYRGEVIASPGSSLLDVSRVQGKLLLKLSPQSQVKIMR